MSDRLAGNRYTVMGLGILGGGVGVAHYLARHGAVVTVTDMRDESQLQDSIAALAQWPITYHLGGHDPADFTAAGADVIVRNPGVPRRSPYLQMAREAGLPIEMEMSLFFRACAAPILGVTGTKGKTSVSTLCGQILQQWKTETVLAGNMGISALALVDDIQPGTPVVIELSSWQLEALDEHRLGPAVSVITNVSPDHLDQYDGFDDYAATKRTIAHHGGSESVVLYNHDDPECVKVVTEASGRAIPFGIRDAGVDGAWVVGDELVWRQDGREERIPRPTQLQLSGDHGAANALAALAATRLYGAPMSAVQRGLEAFRGVPNRMEEVAVVGGVLFVNDTAASAPAAAIAGLRVLHERAKRVHLIAGGADKKTDLTPFADEIALRQPRVLLLDGNATPRLRELLDERNVPYEGPFTSMAAVVQAAAAAASDGDVVTLTPGCASFGLFRNEFDRGEQFRAAVGALRIPA